MSNQSFAPWTDEQVARLNHYQTAGLGHPYTCGNNRTDENHLDSEGVLIAANCGWYCPFCEYVQNWARKGDTE